MTKKFKKRSLSESNVTEKSGNKDTNDVPASPKKLKVEATNAQNNVVSKKMKKGAQGEPNANKKKQVKNKNENNEKKGTPTAVVKEKEETQDDKKPASQEGVLNRKERNKLKKAENNKLIKEKRKIFRQEEGSEKTKTAKLSPEQIQERIKELESRETLSKTAKKKLAVFKKLLQVQSGTNNVQGDAKTEESNNTNASKTTSSTAVAKKQNKKRSLEEASSENKTEKKVKLGKAVKKGINENATKTPTVQSGNKQNAKKQKNTKVQPGSLLRVKSKKDEDEDDDDSSEDEETENEVKPAEDISKEDVAEDDDDDDEDEEEDDDEDDNEVEDEEEGEDEDVDDEEEDEDDEDDEENENEGTDKKIKKKESNDVPKKKGNEVTADKNQDSKKKRYVVFVSNVPYSASADQIRTHFLTKVSKIADVRIPKKPGTNQSRGFCYVELENQEDYEKALSMDHTFIDKRRISVQYSPGKNQANAKQTIVAKNKKLDALRKEGKLAGSKKKTDKKVKTGKQNAVSATA